MITDTLNWVLISGEFIAAGGERFITIGSFKSNAQTAFDTTSWGTDPRAYYYVDDVSVVACDTMPSAPFSIPTIISPGETFYISGIGTGVRLEMYNIRGQIVYRSDNYDNTLSYSLLSSGMYLVRLRALGESTDSPSVVTRSVMLTR